MEIIKTMDKTWDIFGVNSEEEYISKFVIPKNTHKDVPEEINKELILAEQLQCFSFYSYPIYGDAFARLTRVFEIAVNYKAKVEGVKSKNLSGLIKEISKFYPDDFFNDLDWARRMRNTHAHPDLNTIWGFILRKPMILMINIINDIFRSKDYHLNNILRLNEVKNDIALINNSLWIFEDKLIYSIEPISNRGVYTLWMFSPVFKSYPTDEKLFTLKNLFFISEEFIIEENKIVFDLKTNKRIELLKTSKEKNMESLEVFLAQKKLATEKAKFVVDDSIRQDMSYEVAKFEHAMNLEET
ncbi:hypothetical protein [Polaribacter porphyrae]|uniref:Uncharacterized protein n=1 Tax=Polaribacter porphyrae TaxID=1137780 RepID=A0A2S7WP83_9FLAO|nr:hypothetical protein [Polaribacter porphyrae]PQJ79393.1 hypothetical protein BTO18_09500 [Polaribacter porphyrae]